MAENFLPDDKLPDCWKDEARVNVLFAPFRDKSVNAKDWETKLDFWKNLIYLYCVHNRIYTFTYQELSKKFIRNGRSPACLGVVIEEMAKANEIRPLHNFLHKPSETWSGWAAELFLKRPISWSFTKIKNNISTRDINACYVHISAVESDSQRIFDDIPIDVKDKIIDVKSVASILKFDNVEQLNILLHFLLCKGKLSMRVLQNKKNTITLIKFHGSGNTKGVCDRDIDIYTLKETEKALSADIEKLENQVIDLIDTVKKYLSKSQRQSAKSCLRKKKEIEKIIEKRANTLHNIQTLLARVEDAHTDAQILDSYKAALTNLRATFKEGGLTEESVSNTMVELEEVLEMHDDIQTHLAQDTTVDSDIEKELEDLLMNDSIDTKTEEKQNNEISLEEINQKLSQLDMNLPSSPRSDLNKAKISL